MFNSVCFFEGGDLNNTYTLHLAGCNQRIKIEFKLKGFESKIVKLVDYFQPSAEGAISCRLTHGLSNKEFVPYFYATLIGENIASLVHSSSFGNARFVEKTITKINQIFDVNLLSRSEIYLVTLYPYRPRSENIFKVSIYSLKDRKLDCTFTKYFKGDVCQINFTAYLDKLDIKKQYWISIYGPCPANPYLLIDSRTLFHL